MNSVFKNKVASHMETTNPLYDANTARGLQAIRDMYQCPVAELSMDLSTTLQQMYEKIPDWDTVDELANSVREAMVSVTTARPACNRNAQFSRESEFETEETLKPIYLEYKDKLNELRELQKTLARLDHDLNTLAQDLWSKSVDVLNLEPKQTAYGIDIEAGTIYSVNMDCLNCKARKELETHKALIDNHVKETQNG